jgi:hypothetical protein
VTEFAAYSRDQLRRSYAEAWSKRLAGRPLSALEAMIADVIALHPEHQPLFADPDRLQGFEAAAGEAEENPFLHLGLHLAVREQVAIDRPPGVRDLHRRLQAQRDDAHGGEHELMQALAETLWEAQRDGRAPDEQRYLLRARERLRKR